MVFGMQMCGWTHLLSSQQNTPRFRAYRQRIHKAIGTPSTLSRYYPLQEVEVHRFLLRVLDDPDGLLKHIRTEAGAIILKMTYGYTVEPRGHDPLVDIADQALAQFSAATVPELGSSIRCPYYDTYLLGLQALASRKQRDYGIEP